MISDDKNLGGFESVTPPAETRSRPGRREVLKIGALLVPTIATLHATPAWAQTDYTLTAYRYGVNKGLCRNPHFNPNANPDSQAGQEFIPCGQGRTRDYQAPYDQPADAGTVDIEQRGGTVDF